MAILNPKTLVVVDSDAGALNGHDRPSVLAYSPDGAILAAGSYVGDVVLWNVDSKSGGLTLRTHLNDHTGAVANMVFSPDGRQLVTAAYDHSVRVWDVELGQETASYDLQAKLLAFSPLGDRLAIVSLDNKVRVLIASGLDASITHSISKNHAPPLSEFPMAKSPTVIRAAASNQLGFVQIDEISGSVRPRQPYAGQRCGLTCY